MTRGLGWRPDAHDPRDLSARLRLLTDEPPPSASLRRLLGEPLDQGSLGSCVAHAVAKLLFASHRKQGVPDPPLASRLAVYYLARAAEGNERLDAGCTLRAAFRALNALGFCPESAWPYTLERFAEQPPVLAFQLAHDQRKPTDYYRLFEEGAARLDAVRRMVAAGLPVAFGTLVSPAFVADDFAGSIWDPPSLGAVAGGHAMVVGGYDEDGFDVLNSWGPEWGRAGWCRLSPTYLAWGETRDLWVARHAPPFGGR